MLANRPVRLGYLVSHPIQYQAPLLRRIAAEPGIELKVFFMSDFSLESYQDAGFGVTVEWDVPLTEGYEYEVLPRRDSGPGGDFWWPRNTGLLRRINRCNLDVLWIHGYHGSTHLKALLTAKSRGIPTLVRSENQSLAIQRGNGWRRRAKDTTVAGVLRLPAALLPVGTLNADYYRSLGVPNRKLFSMPYAIDNERFRAQALQGELHKDELRKELRLDADRPVILFASKLQTRKRAVDLLSAVKVAGERFGSRKPYLIFVGNGEERLVLEASAEAQGLAEDIRMIGFQNQSVLPRYFALCDLFVLPSAREQFGLVVNEVMCASKAVIVSDEVGCAPDLVREGENGFIFPVGDVLCLAERIVDVLADPATTKRMGERSWEIVREWNFEADVQGLKQALAYVGHPVNE